MLEPTKPADGRKVRSLRAAKKWTQEELATKAGTSVRTVQNAEAGKRIKEHLLECIAEALGVAVDKITSREPIDQSPAPIPGNPEHYVEALRGKWRAVAIRPSQTDRFGHPVEARELVYEVTVLSTKRNTVTALCQCVSEGFEHERFNLKAVVDGQGILMIDGYRDVADGAIHFFRSIMQYHSDGRLKSMQGGFVVFDLDPSGIFVGHMKAVPHDGDSRQEDKHGQSKPRNAQRTSR